MFGSGIGELNVYIKSGSSGMQKIWSLSGDAGNNWYMGQAPISSLQAYQVTLNHLNYYIEMTQIVVQQRSLARGLIILILFFKIVFEGTVGRNSLGNIAIDDVAMVPGVCPSK